MIRAFIIIAALTFSACASQNNSTSKKESKPERQYLTLMEYLQTVPGLSIAQGSVRIRGMQSMIGVQEPLFIVDNVRVGQSYQAAADIVDPNDIRYVRVLKTIAETQEYGMMGSNGVVIIRTGKKK